MPSPKIIWAIDPFHKNNKVFKNSITALQIFAAKTQAKIEPVYIVSPAEARVSLEFSVPAKNRFNEVATQALQKLLKNVSIPGLLKPKVLIENHLRLSASAQTLAQYAASQKAALIVVGTQAKQGLDRFLLGSFAETLITQRKTPLLLISPNMRVAGAFDKILFSSDYSPTSQKSFLQAAGLAAQLEAEVVLYHAVPKPFTWLGSAADFLFGHAEISMDQYLEMKQSDSSEQAEKMRKSAKKFQIPITIYTEKSTKDVPELILAYARKSKSNLIAMAAQSGPESSSSLGKTAREVLRYSQLPVWFS